MPRDGCVNPGLFTQWPVAEWFKGVNIMLREKSKVIRGDIAYYLYNFLKYLKQY